MFFLFSKSKFLSTCFGNKIISFKRNILWHKEPEPDPFIIIRARKEDYGEVINLLWKCYYPDEPTYAALKLGYKYHPIFDQLAYDCLQDGISYLAKCSFTYEVVGGCLNKICCPWDPDDLDKLACKMHSPDVRSFYQFRAYIQRTPCLWQNYCTDRVFELKKLFVRRQDRRRGIAKSLIQASRKLGADSGQKVVRLDATNMFMYVKTGIVKNVLIMFRIIPKLKLLSEILKKNLNTFSKVRLKMSEKKKDNKSCLIVRAQPQDHDCIIEMLWKYYYPHEPCVSSLGLGNKYNPVFDEEALKDLAEDMTVICKCKHTGEMLGACINVSTCCWDSDYYDKIAASCVCSELKELFKFYSFVLKSPCLWLKYGVDKIFEMRTLFVRTEDRNKGIARLLLESSICLGKRYQFKVIRCDATSIYTDRLCTKLKMKMVYDIPYCSYTGNDPEHSPVIKAPPPHTGCRVFIDTPLYEYIK